MIKINQGTLLVAWEDRRTDGQGDIYGARVTAGTVLTVLDASGFAIGSSAGMQNEPVVGAIAPLPGAYDLVFDTSSGGKPGKYTFRVWLNDVRPPTVRLLTRSVRRGTAIRPVGRSGRGS